MTISNRMRAAIALVACTAVGAAGAVAGSAAAPSKTKTTKSARVASAAKARAGHGPGHGPGGRAVHAEEVVLNEAGDKFITETEDNGAIKSISGSEVTIHEAVGTVVYKDVSITLPDSATIERNGTKATLADLKAGDDVHCVAVLRRHGRARERRHVQAAWSWASRPRRPRRSASPLIERQRLSTPLRRFAALSELRVRCRPGRDSGRAC